MRSWIFLLGILFLLGCSQVTPDPLPVVRGAFITELESMIQAGDISVYEINGDIKEHQNVYRLDVYTFKKCTLPNRIFLTFDKKTGEVGTEVIEEHVYTPQGDHVKVELIEYNRCGDGCLLDGEDCDVICAAWESRTKESFVIDKDCERVTE